jgi:hypothetical protein
MIKKLTSKKEEQKKAKKNQLIIGLALVGLMIVSTFGIIVNSFGDDEESQEINYQGYVFEQSNGFYILSLGQNQFYFKSNPLELKDLEYDQNYTKLISNYLSSPIYLDSIDQVAYAELYQNLINFAQKIQPGCIDEETCQNQNYPIKTCEDNLIIIRIAENNNIYQEENCIFIEGKKEDLIKLTDKFLLKIFGVDK